MSVIVPTFGVKDQVTAVVDVPLTVAVKVALWPPMSDAFPGDRLMATGVSIIMPAAIFVESAALVAEIVTTDSFTIDGGAV